MEEEIKKIKRIVILGHNGFVGSHLFSHLNKKYSGPTNIEIIGLSSKDVDLTDTSDCMKLKDYFDLDTVVVMCSGVKCNYGNSIDNYGKNVRMAENLCKVLEKHPVKRFIFFSSTPHF